MKKYIFGTCAALALASCNYTDPVKFNDTLVQKMDSVITYQSDFVGSLGAGGDTMRVAMDRMNNYIDKSISSINKMPEYNDGAEFRSEVVQMLNTMKKSNNTDGKAMMETYLALDPDEYDEAQFDKIDQSAERYDKTWETELDKFDAKQKDYAKKTGITIEEVAKTVK